MSTIRTIVTQGTPDLFPAPGVHLTRGENDRTDYTGTYNIWNLDNNVGDTFTFSNRDGMKNYSAVVKAEDGDSMEFLGAWKKTYNVTDTTTNTTGTLYSDIHGNNILITNDGTTGNPPEQNIINSQEGGAHT